MKRSQTKTPTNSYVIKRNKTSHSPRTSDIKEDNNKSEQIQTFGPPDSLSSTDVSKNKIQILKIVNPKDHNYVLPSSSYKILGVYSHKNSDSPVSDIKTKNISIGSSQDEISYNKINVLNSQDLIKTIQLSSQLQVLKVLPYNQVNFKLNRTSPVIQASDNSKGPIQVTCSCVLEKTSGSYENVECNETNSAQAPLKLVLNSVLRNEQIERNTQTEILQTCEKSCQTDCDNATIIEGFSMIDHMSFECDYKSFITNKDVHMGFGPKMDNLNSNLRASKLAVFNDLKMCTVFDSGNLPIHKAVMENDIITTRKQCVVLRARKVGCNVMNDYGYTPLHLSIVHGCDEDLVDLLLAFSADISLTDPNGNNVLHMCVEHNKIALLDVFLKNMHLCGYNGYIDINAMNHDGMSPLMMAAVDNKIKICEMLIEKDASPNLRDMKSGRTALFFATENENVEIVRLLLLNGGNTRIENFLGISVYDAVFELDNIKISSLILGPEHVKSYRKPEISNVNEEENKKKRGRPKKKKNMK